MGRKLESFIAAYSLQSEVPVYPCDRKRRFCECYFGGKKEAVQSSHRSLPGLGRWRLHGQCLSRWRRNRLPWSVFCPRLPWVSSPGCGTAVGPCAGTCRPGQDRRVCGEATATAASAPPWVHARCAQPLHEEALHPLPEMPPAFDLHGEAWKFGRIDRTSRWAQLLQMRKNKDAKGYGL